MENDFFESYQTSEWQRKKNAVLERDDYTCQICGSKNGLMQVHHITYKHCKGKAYNAPMGDLITLCERCHANDDGDHEHFYDAEFRIVAGIERPQVISLGYIVHNGKETDDDFWYGWMKGLIISAQHKYLSWRCVGFFTSVDSKGKNAWFPFLQGLEGENNIYVQADHGIEDFSDIRLADVDEAYKFISIVEEGFPEFGEMVKVTNWLWGAATQTIFEVNVPYFESRYYDYIHEQAAGSSQEKRTSPMVQQEQPSEIVLRSRSNPKIMVNVPTINRRIMVKMPNDMK